LQKSATHKQQMRKKKKKKPSQNQVQKHLKNFFSGNAENRAKQIRRECQSLAEKKNLKLQTKLFSANERRNLTSLNCGGRLLCCGEFVGDKSRGGPSIIWFERKKIIVNEKKNNCGLKNGKIS
jgi:delta 1-pyrroline-5-carboxylate dehydrogenase